MERAAKGTSEALAVAEQIVQRDPRNLSIRKNGNQPADPTQYEIRIDGNHKDTLIDEVKITRDNVNIGRLTLHEIPVEKIKAIIDLLGGLKKQQPKTSCTPTTRGGNTHD